MRSIEGTIDEAAKRDLSRVTTRGSVWVRDGVDKAAAWDAVAAARDSERERCAKLAEDLSARGFSGSDIATVIRAGKRYPQESNNG